MHIEIVFLFFLLSFPGKFCVEGTGGIQIQKFRNLHSPPLGCACFTKKLFGFKAKKSKNGSVFSHYFRLFKAKMKNNFFEFFAFIFALKFSLRIQENK